MVRAIMTHVSAKKILWILIALTIASSVSVVVSISEHVLPLLTGRYSFSGDLGRASLRKLEVINSAFSSDFRRVKGIEYRFLAESDLDFTAVIRLEGPCELLSMEEEMPRFGDFIPLNLNDDEHTDRWSIFTENRGLSWWKPSDLAIVETATGESPIPGRRMYALRGRSSDRQRCIVYALAYQ